MADAAVVGVGAVGGVVAARLSGVREVWACVRQPFDELVLEGPPPETLRARPRVLADAREAAPCPWVLLATKTYDVAGAAPWLARLVGPDSVVAVLQNGVEHEERVKPWMPQARILPVVVQCPCTRTAPGHVVQREPAILTVPSGPDGDAFARLFEGSGVEVNVAPDFASAAWRKLCFNAVTGAITTLLGTGIGVTREPDVAALALELLRECLAVARAEGAALSDAEADALLASMQSHASDTPTSMSTDREAGRPLEIDARNRVIVRLGRRHGIETPRNRSLTALLGAVGREPVAPEPSGTFRS